VDRTIPITTPSCPFEQAPPSAELRIRMCSCLGCFGGSRGGWATWFAVAERVEIILVEEERPPMPATNAPPNMKFPELASIYKA
jgi:hypothetical protein